MKNRLRALAFGVAALILAAGCTAGSVASPSGVPSDPSPSAAASSASSPSAAPSVGGAPSAPVTSAEQAARLVLGQRPEFASLGPYDPELIGGCCWYEVTPLAGGYQVKVTIGWGDCPAGCIEKHEWTYMVAPDGRVGLINETGPSLPPNPNDY